MKPVVSRLLLTVALVVSAASLTAADLFPLDQVKAGLRGTGRTVFSGEQVEEFEVEILGVLHNIAPGESLILARLKGGPLEKTGVAAGMSGSPVYLDGKLAGAIAYSFPFSTEPIAGIRPIHEMIERLDDAATGAANRAGGGLDPDWTLAESGGRFIPNPQAELWPAGPRAAANEPQLLPIAMPVALAGFSERTFEVFGEQLRRLGLRPAQGVGGRGTSDEPPATPQPGSMIGVALIQGDMELSAAGTVTHVENGRLYAFGHRFLSSGPTEMPLLASSVITMVPNLNNSFKIAASGGPLGVITQDRASGISGELGRTAKLLPLAIGVKSGGEQRRYKMELVKDRTLSPFLMQMAVFSAVDTTERQIGASSYRVSGQVDLGDGLPPLRLDNMYAGSNGVALQLATLTSIPLAYLLNLDFKDVTPRGIELEIEVIDEEQRLDVDRGWVSKTRARAGETIELAAALRDGDGDEIVKKTEFRIPPGTKPGVLEVTFSDGGSLNMLDWRIFASPTRTEDPAQIVRAMNRLRRNDRLYVRVWQSSQAFLLNTERLPSPPASVLALLSSPRAQGGGVTADWQSTIHEFELDGLDGVIQGSVSTRITIIE